MTLMYCSNQYERVSDGQMTDSVDLNLDLDLNSNVIARVLSLPRCRAWTLKERKHECKSDKLQGRCMHCKLVLGQIEFHSLIWRPDYLFLKLWHVRLPVPARSPCTSSPTSFTFGSDAFTSPINELQNCCDTDEEKR